MIHYPSPTDYPIAVIRLDPEDGGGFLATVPDLPGCASDGATPDEARRNVLLAIAEWTDEATRLGRVVPEPDSRLRPAPSLSKH